MSWEQFWNGDPWIATAYRRKHSLDIDSRNQEIWLQGLYNYRAVKTAIANTINGKADTYPEQPERITPPSEREKQIEIENEKKKAIKYFTDLEKRWKAKHKEEDSGTPT